MIVIVHNEAKIVYVYNTKTNKVINLEKSMSLANSLLFIAKENPEALIIWVCNELKDYINLSELTNIFHHKNILSSYNAGLNYIIPETIGYVDRSPFANVKKDVNYPTWLMSSDIGGIHAETLVKIAKTVSLNENFDFYLTSLAKHNMPTGLFCYSNPNLLKKKENLEIKQKKTSNYLLFKFIKQHYKWVWVINLFLCFLIYERRVNLFPLLKSFYYKQFKKIEELNPLSSNSSLKVIEKKTIDVIIPTIGRKDSLLNVLLDLACQTHLPVNVIIVEQNPDKTSTSELDFIKNKEWPFKITHKYIHQTGACNARNLALSFVKSEWVLLGDDDNRFESNLIEKLFWNIEKLGVNVVTTMYIQPNETTSYLSLSQTDIFGSGNSILKSSLLKTVQFDRRFEFGYGEDSDFGMQLRKSGNDVIYLPEVKITHLKLPFGGFRTKFVHKWHEDKIQPKPSPTIMLYYKKHLNEYQKRANRYILFLKFYKKQKTIINPFAYCKLMNKQWEQSIYWSKKLYKRDNA